MRSNKQGTTRGRSRRRWSESEARSMLAALERSGESVVAFARSQGVTAQRLHWWRQRLGPGADRRTGPERVGLVPVRVRYEGGVGLVPGEGGRSTVLVRSVGGAVIEVPLCVAPDWIAALARALEDR